MARAYSGQITVATAGTAVQGPATGQGIFLLAASVANTGDYCYVGEDGAGDVSSTTGFVLEKSTNQVYFNGDLNSLYFDSDTSGDKVCWLRMEGGGGSQVVEGA